MFCKKIVVFFLATYYLLLITFPVNAQTISVADYQKALSDPRIQSAIKNSGATKTQSNQNNNTAIQKQDSSSETDPSFTSVNKEEKGLVEIEKYFSNSASLENLSKIRLYGYDAFKKMQGASDTDTQSSSNSIIPFVSDVETPVPTDYVIGPGDSFKVTMWGISEGIFDVTVDSQGDIILPKVGVINVAGIKYGALQPFIQKQLGQYYEQVNVNVTMSKIKTIRVFVVGEVANPGSYAVSSLSSVYSLLFQAGGPTKSGTLRNIQLMHNGKKVAAIDLYKFLLAGDKSQDKHLTSGDTIFVPTRGPVVGITGNVNRPAIYEIKDNTDLADIISLAGGFSPLSYLNRVQIERIVAHQKKIMVDEKLSNSQKKFNILVQDMDLVKVYPIFSEIQNVVYLEGHFKYIGPYEYKPGMRLKDVVSSKNLLKPYPYLPKGEVVRFDPDTLQTEIFDIDLGKLFAGDEKQNILLTPNDKIRAGSDFRPQARVVLDGEVVVPGEYIIKDGETLGSVIRRAGGFTSRAYLFGAVFTRQSAQAIQENASVKFLDDLEKRLIEEEIKLTTNTMLAPERILQKESSLQKNKQLLEKLRSSLEIKGRVIVNLDSIANFVDSPSDFALENGDKLYVPPVPDIVSVLGEVYNPSSVVFQGKAKGEYYLKKVGGTTNNADKGNIYVIRADGSVLSGYGSVASTILLPGDTILVPQVIERFDWWGAFSDFTHWFYEASLALAVYANYIKK